MGKTVIAINRETVLGQLNQSINIWTVGGGRERTELASRARYQSKLLAKAPKTIGYLWWKRETTETERRHWMENMWENGGGFDEGWYHRFWHDRYIAALDERFLKLKTLRAAVNKAPDHATIYIDAHDWEFANRNF